MFNLEFQNLAKMQTATAYNNALPQQTVVLLVKSLRYSGHFVDVS